MRPIVASDLMTPDVLTVPHDMTVRELATFLVDNEISGAPVRGAKGNLIGVVSVVDVVRVTSEEDGDSSLPDDSEPDFYRRDEWADTLSEGEAPDLEDLEGELQVRDILTPVVYSVTEDATVDEIASLMLQHHLHRVLVKCSDDGRAVGIITTSDLLGLLVDEDT